MISTTFKRALAVATTIGLAIIALSVVAGTLVETRGPRADRLPEVSLASPGDVGAVVAEVGWQSAPSVSSTAAPTKAAPTTTAPTTTVTSLVVASGPSRRASSTDGDSTWSNDSYDGSVSNPSRPAITTPLEPPTIVRSGTRRAVPTATTAPRAKESTKTRTGTHSTTTIEDSSTTTTSEHEVVPPTVREDDDTDH